jgi:hypothetical protein
MPDAEVAGLGFSPWVGLGTWDFPWGISQRKQITSAKSDGNSGDALPISLWWLEYVDDSLSALAVKSFS